MNTNSENLLSRNLVLQQWLADNSVAIISLIASVGGPNGLIAKYDAVMQVIIDAAEAAGLDIKGYAVNKRNKRETLESHTDNVSSVLVGYADEIEDAVLEKMFHLPPSYISGLRDSELYVKAQTVYEKALNIDTSSPPSVLIDYGLTPTSLPDLLSAITAYKLVIQSPRMAQLTKSVNLDLLTDNLKKASGLIDKFKKRLAPLRQSSPQLWAQFEGVILISDNAATHDGSSDEPADAEGSLPVLVPVTVTLDAGLLASAESVKIEIIGGQFAQASFNNGSNPLPPGLSPKTVNGGEAQTFTKAELNYDAMLRPELVLFNNGTSVADYKVWLI